MKLFDRSNSNPQFVILDSNARSGITRTLPTARGRDVTRSAPRAVNTVAAAHAHRGPAANQNQSNGISEKIRRGSGRDTTLYTVDAGNRDELEHQATRQYAGPNALSTTRWRFSRRRRLRRRRWRRRGGEEEEAVTAAAVVAAAEEEVVEDSNKALLVRREEVRFKPPGCRSPLRSRNKF